MATKARGTRQRLIIADAIPEAQWCDVRREYLVEGKTVAQIAHERGCGVRAVSRLIKSNRNYSEIGKRQTPSVLDGYHEKIEVMLKNIDYHEGYQITLISTTLFPILQAEGYQGSERTLRDYIRTLPWRTWIIQSAKQNKEKTP